MASERQIAANRRNAQKSTGPKTENGKAASRFNALRHGFAAKHFVLSIEDEPEFNSICDEFLAEHQPATPTEFLLLEQIVTAAWRLRRLRKAETAYLEKEMQLNTRDIEDRYAKPGDWDHLAYTYRNEAIYSTTMLNFSRYEARLERSLYRAIHALQKVQKERSRAAVQETKAAEIAAAKDANPQIGFVRHATPINIRPVQADPRRPEVRSTPDIGYTHRKGQR